jgi:hypothetical protein
MSTDYTVADSTFEGTASKNDFHAALQEAIAAAMSGLHTDLVHWRLLEVTGEYGGFAPVSNMTVKIEAKVGPAPQS